MRDQEVIVYCVCEPCNGTGYMCECNKKEVSFNELNSKEANSKELSCNSVMFKFPDDEECDYCPTEIRNLNKYVCSYCNAKGEVKIVEHWACQEN